MIPLMIDPSLIAAALAGANPALGHRLTAGELGRRLAPHRRGRYAGQPFTKQAISLYSLRPDQQSADFAEAFTSWRAAETLRQEQLRVRVNGLTADELLAETGYVQQIGNDPVKALLAIGQLPAHTLISVNSTATAVECTASLRACQCGQWFVPRTWNHARCTRCARQRQRQPAPVTPCGARAPAAPESPPSSPGPQP